ncbi:restriction endonuclease [Halobacillus salinus]|uniref:Restriction endonuclease n=1 Tax=Halobacillus salinus TaxID=192814 RepID=A0A4Z0GVW9_9BACI|nr:restriction endonuclease [Halobacillus salinus]TGB01075.1 restriction endonuclease [Halobacillus salinus]
MIYFEIALGVLLVIAAVHFKMTKRKNNYQTTLLLRQLDSNEEMKKTLAMGLYLRFRKENLDETTKLSSLYLRQEPISFEHFTADLIQKARGGSTWVTPPSHDFGVDFEHTIDGNIFLGQAKCQRDDLGYEPIALVHSNMVKKGAQSGYVITPGSFTPAARKYVKGLNIELIDGLKLVDLWIVGLDNVEQEIKDFIPAVD